MDILTSVCGKTGSSADKCLGIMHSEANQGGHGRCRTYPLPVGALGDEPGNNSGGCSVNVTEHPPLLVESCTSH